MSIYLPNFLFIGPDKAGSTWLYHCLREHPDVFLPKSKELFFFDQFYGLGLEWYSKQFRAAMPHHIVRADISHDYLFSEIACQRIRDILPDAKLMVTFREPTERAFSAYLYMVRQGRVSSTFEEALLQVPELVGHGMYYHHLKPYLQSFPMSQLHFTVFDDLVSDPHAYYSRLCGFLGIDPISTTNLSEPVLPAAQSRIPALTAALRSIGGAFRLAGAPGVVGRLKESKIFQKLLFAQFSDGQKPAPRSATLQSLRAEFSDDLRDLDEAIGTTLCSRWNY